MPYKFFFVPLIVAIISQLIKLITDGVKGNLNFKTIWQSYGGMPSSHAAFVSSISTVVAIYQGLDSISFAICLVFSIIILRDATGLRMITENQSLAINKLIKKLPAEQQKSIDSQKESVGHTYPEIFVGTGLGIILTLLALTIL